MSAALNLEAAVLGVYSVCTRCARCARALGLVQGLVQGLVVAGHFWCSYAWVSLTMPAPVRPLLDTDYQYQILLPACLCSRVCARLCRCVLSCARVLSCAGVLVVTLCTSVGGVCVFL